MCSVSFCFLLILWFCSGFVHEFLVNKNTICVLISLVIMKICVLKSPLGGLVNFFFLSFFLINFLLQPLA